MLYDKQYVYKSFIKPKKSSKNSFETLVAGARSRML